MGKLDQRYSTSIAISDYIREPTGKLEPKICELCGDAFESVLPPLLWDKEKLNICNKCKIDLHALPEKYRSRICIIASSLIVGVISAMLIILFLL